MYYPTLGVLDAGPPQATTTQPVRTAEGGGRAMAGQVVFTAVAIGALLGVLICVTTDVIGWVKAKRR